MSTIRPRVVSTQQAQPRMMSGSAPAQRSPAEGAASSEQLGSAPAREPGLSPSDRDALVASVRRAPLIPSKLMREPAVAALADQARNAIARRSNQRPEDIELDVRVLPGSDERILLFRDARGHASTKQLDAPLSHAEAHKLGRALGDLNVIAGVGAGYRIVPGVVSSGATATVSRLSGQEGLPRHIRAGGSTTIGGLAYVWDVTERPRPVGASTALSAPYVSAGNDPLMGDRLEFSIPGYATLIAAVKPGQEGSPDVGWLGVVWHHGLLGPGPGPTVHAKLVVGHPALAPALRPAVNGAVAALSPVMARMQALRGPRGDAQD